MKYKLILLYLCILLSSCAKDDIFVDDNWKADIEWVKYNNQYYMDLDYNGNSYRFIITLNLNNVWRTYLVKDNSWYIVYTSKFEKSELEDIKRYIEINFRVIIKDIENKNYGY